MIEADIRGKLPEIAHGEDFLTSTVFGMLKYSPMRAVLSEFLGKATRYSGGGAKLGSALSAGWPLTSNMEIRFWERSGEFGTPDILILDGALALVVEVKFESEVSGDDQLRKYGRLLDARFPDMPKRHVVYLTKDITAPNLGPEVTRGIEENLWWLSWYDLSESLDTILLEEGIGHEMAADLLRFLGHRELSVFRGFANKQFPLEKPLFWFDTTPLISEVVKWPTGRPYFWQARIP